MSGYMIFYIESFFIVKKYYIIERIKLVFNVKKLLIRLNTLHKNGDYFFSHFLTFPLSHSQWEKKKSPQKTL